MSLKIAHLSDPHFGTVTPEKLAALRRALDRLKPDLILLSGDITQRARRREFKEAQDFVLSLAPVPVISIPGNHDIPLWNLVARFSHPYFGFRHFFKGVLSRHVAFDEVEVVALNSTSRFRHVQGDFKIDGLKKHLKWFSEDENDRHKLRILVFHHPMDCRKGVDEKNLLKGRDEAVRLFAGARVDLVLGGHIHDPYISLSDERYPQIDRRMIFAVGGTCLSWRTRLGAPNSFNWIEILDPAGPGGSTSLQISRMDLNDKLEFTSVAQRSFSRALHGGWEKAHAELSEK